MTGRPALCSEYAIIRAAYANTPMTPPSRVSVYEELYARSRISAERLFNADFTLSLLPELPENRVVTSLPVRPHTIGADLFVVIRNDGAPALLDLVGGEAFPLQCFADAVERVDAAIGGLFGASCAEAAYLRIVELDTGISFLAAKSDISRVTCLPAYHRETECGPIDTRRLHDEIVMVDGVLEDR